MSFPNNLPPLPPRWDTSQYPNAIPGQPQYTSPQPPPPLPVAPQAHPIATGQPHSSYTVQSYPNQGPTAATAHQAQQAASNRFGTNYPPSQAPVASVSLADAARLQADIHRASSTERARILNQFSSNGNIDVQKFFDFMVGKVNTFPLVPHFDRSLPQEEWPIAAKELMTRAGLMTNTWIPKELAVGAENFLAYKRQYGTAAEKDLYREMTVFEFFKRLKTQRPIVYWNPTDNAVLRKNLKGENNYYESEFLNAKAVLTRENLQDPQKVMQLEALINKYGKTFDAYQHLLQAGVPKDQAIYQVINEGALQEVDSRFFDQLPHDPIHLKDYLTRDEMKFSALTCEIVKTRFCNDGSRNNEGKLGKDPNTYFPDGFLIGAVGARFEKPGIMDWQECVIAPTQNTPQQGYGREGHYPQKYLMDNMARTLGMPEGYFPTYVEVEQQVKAAQGKDPRFIQLSGYVYEFRNSNYYFDTLAYKQRLKLTFKSILRAATNAVQLQIRENQTNSPNSNFIEREAFVRLTGLGLGAWKLGDFQTKYMLEALKETLDELDQKGELNHISHIDLTYFIRGRSAKIGQELYQAFGYAQPGSNVHDTSKIQETGVGIAENPIYYRTRSGHAIILFASDSEMAARPPQQFRNDQKQVLVAPYAWDSNSWPGNEYWIRKHSASGDPAAVCCGYDIPSLQTDANPVRACTMTVH